MDRKDTTYHNSAAKAIASVFGVLSGFGGITHGIGEILQGNVPPEGTVISSWTQGPIAAYFDGDPAMTVFSSVLVAGIATLIVAGMVIMWSLLFIRKKYGGLILTLLSITMFMTGGGFGPPTLGLLAGLGGMGIHAPYTWWRTHLSAKAHYFMGRLWPWIFGICVLNGVFLVIGHVIAAYFFAPVDGELFLNSFFFTVLLLLISILTGIAYDIQKSKQRTSTSN